MNRTDSGAAFARYLTVAEERRLFACVRQFADVLARRDAAWMQAMRHTGVRVQAFSRLTVFDAREALRSGYLVLRPEIQKRRHGHREYLNKPARAAFRALLAVRREMGHADHPDAPLVMSRNHRAMSVRSYQARLANWAALAGLEVRVSPHWFRHTVAKRIMAQSTARDPLAVVQAVLGHVSRRSSEVYTRPDRETVALALEEMA